MILQFKLNQLVVIGTGCWLFIEMKNKSFLYFKNLEQVSNSKKCMLGIS